MQRASAPRRSSTSPACSAAAAPRCSDSASWWHWPLRAVLAPLLRRHDPDAIDTARRLARPLTAGSSARHRRVRPRPAEPAAATARASRWWSAWRPRRWPRWPARCAACSRASSAAGSIRSIMRSIDTLMAFPYFLLAIAIIAALGPGLVNGMVAVAVVNIPFYGRIVRATVLAVKRDGVRGSGARARRVGAAPVAHARAAQLPGARSSWPSR